MTDDFPVRDGVLTLPGELKYLRSQQFCGRDDIKKVILEPGIGFMEEEVFAECPNLKEAVLPEGLIHLGVAAFTDCTALSTVVLPSTIRSIEDGAFLSCSALKHIALPEGLEEIRSLAFQSSGLETVSVPASVKRIGEEAFFACASLRRADVLCPDTVLEEDAFGSCYALTEGYIAPGFPPVTNPPAELLYSMLWASCPTRHSPAVSARAESFIRRNEVLVMERIFKYNNLPTLTGLVQKGLLCPDHIDAYVRTSLESGFPEITALLLQALGSARASEEEFEL